MEGSFFYRTENAEIHSEKMHLTVINHHPGFQGAGGEAVKRETENQLFRVFKKYDD